MHIDFFVIAVIRHSCDHRRNCDRCSVHVLSRLPTGPSHGRCALDDVLFSTATLSPVAPVAPTHPFGPVAIHILT